MQLESSTSSSHLSVAATTTEIDEVESTTGDNMTSASSSTVDVVYFQCAVLVIGVVGAAANALILYATVASKEHKKQFKEANTAVCTCKGKGTSLQTSLLVTQLALFRAVYMPNRLFSEPPTLSRGSEHKFSVFLCNAR